MQSSGCDERIESFASLPYFITLLNFSVNVFCTEVQWNLDITNPYITESSVGRTIFFTPVIIANTFTQSLGPSLQNLSLILQFILVILLTEYD